jgi:hypothetical protein
MAISVKKITLWRKEALNNPGVLAEVLGPLAEGGASLRVVMGYANPADPERAVIELFPVAGKKATAAAGSAGLSASSTACLLVEGDDRPGLGAAMGRAIADAGVNISFLVAQSIGKKFTAVFGFGSEEAAGSAINAVRSAGKAPAAKKASRKAPRRAGKKKRKRR